MIGNRAENLALLVTLALVACDSAAASEQGTQGHCEQWGPIALPWADGAYAVRQTSALSMGPYLVGSADKVEAVSEGGRKVLCSVTELEYKCESTQPLTETIATLGKQRLSLHFPAVCWRFAEDAYRLTLDDAEPCVEPDTTVVEGELLGLDPARPTPRVTLEGPWQLFKISNDSSLDEDLIYQGHIPGIECTVRDGHYACPTLGLRTTATHAVVAGGVRTEVSLPVSGCKATRQTLDVSCPAFPRGFYVKLPKHSRPIDQVTASYAGGVPYPCFLEPQPAYRSAHQSSDDIVTFLCPAAGGDEWGRGRYEVAAPLSAAPDQSYVGVIIDPFDACGGADKPLELQLAEAEE